MIDVVQFIALVLTALSMSVHFGTWLTERPLRRTQSGALFIEVHKGRDEVAARVMPILGNAAILFLALGAFFARTDPAAFLLSVVALMLVIGDMVVTLKGNVASLADPRKLFNSSLDGNTRRAIDIREGEVLDTEAFKALIRAAVAENLQSSAPKSQGRGRT